MRTCLYEEDFTHPEVEMYFHIYTMDFPEMHDHNYWEFLLILSGEVKHKTEDSSQILSSNMGCLIHPKDKHLFVGSTHKYQHLNIMITDKRFKKLCDIVSKDKYEQLCAVEKPILYEIPDNTIAEIKKLVEVIQTVNNNLESYTSLLTLLWMMILKFIYCTDLHTCNHYPDWLNTFIDKLHQPQNMCKSVEELVPITDYSYTHLGRLFKKHTGKTMRNYIAELRINYAAMLLRTTDMNILEISSTVGYDSLSHFITIFKSYFNVTPTSYRKISTK